MVCSLYRHTVRLHASLYLPGELAQHLVAIALLDDTLDPAVEAVAVLCGEVLGRDHHYRDLLPLRTSSYLVKKFEAVHLGHHQVENDHIRQAGGKRVHGDTAIFR